jgi:DNA-binding PadR family transcriptional regulator
MHFHDSLFHHPLAFGRHHGGGRGLPRFGQGFMDEGGMGGQRFGMGRKLGSPDLQLIIVGLLAEKPSHGYEIIKALEERSKGFYVPSAGMVYPALTYLEEAEYAVSETQGNRKLYRLTPAGTLHLAQNRARFDAMLAQLERIGAKMARVRRAFDADSRAFDADSGALGAAARREQPGRDAIPELREARARVKAAMDSVTEAPREEQLRVAELLNRAAQEISGR